MSTGFTDKLYWRPFGGQHHCLKRVRGSRVFVSLCGRYTSKRSGGGQMLRPHVGLRCGKCDGEEMKRRGWDESGPQNDGL